MVECVLRIWKEPGLVEELGGLELSEAAAQRAFILAGDCVKKGERHILANHRSGLKQAFVLGREPVDAGGDNRLRGGGDLRGVHGARETIRAALSGECPRLDERPHALFENEWIALRAFYQEPPQRIEPRIWSKQRSQEYRRALLG